jgi:hypothetical protein
MNFTGKWKTTRSRKKENSSPERMIVLLTVTVHCNLPRRLGAFAGKIFVSNKAPTQKIVPAKAPRRNE